MKYKQNVLIKINCTLTVLDFPVTNFQVFCVLVIDLENGFFESKESTFEDT